MQSIIHGRFGQGLRTAALLVLAASCTMAAATSATAEAGSSRPGYQGRCDLPRAGWNEEVLRAREAAERECKDNAVVLASDRSATVTREAQQRFWTLKQQHDDLVRRAR
jgi:hypothetical protein